MSSVRVLETPDIHLFFIRSEMIWQEKLLVISDAAHFDHVFFTKNFYNHMAMNDGRSRRDFKWFLGGSFSAYFVIIWLMSKDGMLQHLTTNLYSFT